MTAAWEAVARIERWWRERGGCWCCSDDSIANESSSTCGNGSATSGRGGHVV